MIHTTIEMQNMAWHGMNYDNYIHAGLWHGMA